MQDFFKSKGHEANRLAYMLLSSIKDLPYVDPAAVYSLPAFMTDEEFEEMQEANEQITSNTLISSIIEQLKWISNGPFII